MRLSYDFADPNSSQFVISTGQSTSPYQNILGELGEEYWRYV